MTRTGIYKNPELYQCAFSYRQVPREVDSLLAWHSRHSDQLTSVIELAAGPTDHALEFAKRGIAADVLDSERAMLDFSSRRAAERGVRLATHRGDMISFNLSKRFDLGKL